MVFTIIRNLAGLHPVTAAAVLCLEVPLQAREQGLKREPEASRSVSHRSISFKSISFEVVNKSERKSGKGAGGDGYQPVMMTFKVKMMGIEGKGRDDGILVQAFLGTQDDAITDEEAAASDARQDASEEAPEEPSPVPPPVLRRRALWSQ